MQHLLVLRDARGYSIAQSFTGGIESLSAADATKLKFVNQDGQYVLTEVSGKSRDFSRTTFVPVEE